MAEKLSVLGKEINFLTQKWLAANPKVTWLLCVGGGNNSTSFPTWTSGGIMAPKWADFSPLRAYD